MKIILEVDKCIGCGFCEAVCPEFWKMNGDKTSLKKGKTIGKAQEMDVKEAGCNEETANGCPAQCIKIKK
jgi:ferredoxin